MTQRNTLADSVPNQKEGEVTLCTYNKGNEEEGDNYTNLAEMASDYDVYLTKELGDDKKGPSLIGKTFNVALLYTVSMWESLLWCVSEERKEDVSTETQYKYYMFRFGSRASSAELA